MPIVQGPGIAEGAMNAAMAPPEKRAGIIGTVAHEMYRHPIRNAIAAYTLMPWMLANTTSKGLKWPGFYGYRGLVGGGAGWAPWATGPIRRGFGAFGSAITRGWAPTVAEGFATFGKGGLSGLGTKYNNTILKSLGVVVGGGEAGHFGLFGYNFLGGHAFSQFGTAQEILKASTAVSKQFGGAGTMMKYIFSGKAGKALLEEKITQAFATELLGKGGGSMMGSYFAGGAVSRTAARNFLRLGSVATVAAGAAYISLAYDIAKFAAKTSYKLVDAGVTTANNMLSDIVSQEWGGRLSAAYITAGATSERQRALSEINRSSMNARGLLGSEASLAARTYLGGRIV